MDDPDPAGNIILQLLLLLVLILVNAFFAMSEIAVISLNDNKIQKMAEEGHKKAKQILRLTENSSNFLSTIQIGVTLAGFLTSASASQTFADKLATAIAQPKVVAVIPSARRACAEKDRHAEAGKGLLPRGRPLAVCGKNNKAGG